MQSLKNWFIRSSKDPQKIALTVKAGVPFVITILTTLGLSFTNIDVQDLTGTIGDFVFNLVQAISFIATAYGLGRKIYLTAINLYTK